MLSPQSMLSQDKNLLKYNCFFNTTFLRSNKIPGNINFKKYFFQQVNSLISLKVYTFGYVKEFKS